MRNLGFTLLEVMVTLAIVSILGALAMPSYSDYLVRGRIPAATAGLAARQIRIEQFFQDNRTYLAAPDCVADSSSSTVFTFSCSAQTNTTFVLQAVGKSSMSGFTYVVDQSNVKTTTAVPAGWSLPSPNNCWITKKGGAC
jgi:type IV pilus assembly protein PilE